MNINQIIEETDTKALLAVIMVLATIASTFVFGNVPETLGTLTGLAVVFYFQK